MISLDTNVISEIMRPKPDKRVMDWLDRQEMADVFLTAISEAELKYGIATMPEGKRRSFLAETLGTILWKDFEGRILIFDSNAADAYARR